MKVNKTNEERLVSALKLAKASGKIVTGLKECTKKLESDKGKLLFAAEGLKIKKTVKKFEIPTAEKYSRRDVEIILKRYTTFLKKKTRIKHKVDIGKESRILKALAIEKRINVIEGFNRKKLGKIIGLNIGCSFILVLDYGRSENLFKEVIKK